jgi:branched-chain amino acid transport system ATP-binding protein
MSEPLLRVEGVTASYGKVRAVEDVSLVVGEGEVVAVVGHNGAGKSTLLKAIMGAVRPGRGRVEYAGRDVTESRVSQRVRAGLCLVPQSRNTFGEMSVAENLEFSARLATNQRTLRARRIADVYELFPALRDKAGSHARSLSGGQRQMLAIGIAMVKEPRLLLLDEPSIGLAPVLVERVFDNILEINRSRSTTVIVVEQNVHEAFRIASRAYVMWSGRMLLEDTASSLRERSDLMTLL